MPRDRLAGLKREGNDDQWLSRLKKRRVSELLADDIPEDEALLMKNGRLCCMVCHHRPTFDTLEMLSIHRRGKKHETNATIFHGKQRELIELKEKRSHATYIKDGTTVGLGAEGSVGSFLKAEPYNPQLKRKRLKPNQRKRVVQLFENTPVEEEFVPSATKLSQLPGNQRPYESPHGLTETIVGRSSTVELSHDTRRPPPVTERANPNDPIKNGPNQKLPQTISEYVKRTAAMNRAPTVVRPYMGRTEAQVSVSQKNDATPIGQSELPLKTREIKSQCGAKSSECKSQKVNKKSRSISKPPQKDSNVDEEKKRNAQKYLQATSSGWKLDWTRQKWVRDEDVEFDSDEEPPELPT